MPATPTAGTGLGMDWKFLDVATSMLRIGQVVQMWWRPSLAQFRGEFPVDWDYSISEHALTSMGKKDWMNIKWKPSKITHSVQSDGSSYGVFVMQPHYLCKMVLFGKNIYHDAQYPRNISGQESPAANVQDEMAPNESEAEGQLKRRTNPETWKANIQKRRRMKGLSYLGRRHNEEHWNNFMKSRQIDFYTVRMDDKRKGRGCQRGGGGVLQAAASPPGARSRYPPPSHCIMGNVVVSSSMAPSLLF
ncbi:hypothetical protein NFI96_001278 [Prochilodus magdalenae]|nr:hypothetical protein NFI96_001278 [Prochilodus magdalenae]